VRAPKRFVTWLNLSTLESYYVDDAGPDRVTPILLADDDANQAFLAVRAFKDAGVPNPLMVVPDGTSAVEYLAGNGKYADRAAHPLPCLLLLDQTLPGRSGLEVLEWVRAKSRMCTLPVLILSASTSDSDVHAAYLLGANGYVVKPATLDEMRDAAKAIRDYWLKVNRAPSPG
jgi:DNA-binding response OmpR family regulator